MVLCLGNCDRFAILPFQSPIQLAQFGFIPAIHADAWIPFAA
jgi:hypothetical protein